MAFENIFLLDFFFLLYEKRLGRCRFSFVFSYFCFCAFCMPVVFLGHAPHF